MRHEWRLTVVCMCLQARTQASPAQRPWLVLAAQRQLLEAVQTQLRWDSSASVSWCLLLHAASMPCGALTTARVQCVLAAIVAAVTPAKSAAALPGACCRHVAGFKSRALRVGGSADTPATAEAEAALAPDDPAAAAAAPPLHTDVPAAGGMAAAGCSSSTGAGDDSSDAAAAGRKRRAAANSVPSPSVSPKLAAAVRHGQQCRVQPGEDAAMVGTAEAAAPSGSQAQSRTLSHTAEMQPCAAPQDGGSHAGAGRSQRAASDTPVPTDDDTVPLVGSKLAARVSQERGTPLASSGRGRDAGEWWAACGRAVV